MKIKQAYDELTGLIAALREDLIGHISQFVGSLDTVGTIVQGDNRELVRLQGHMDEFFNTYTTPFLAAVAVLIKRMLRQVQQDFDGDYQDIQGVEEALGIRDDRIVRFVNGKMTVLYGIAAMKVLENDLVIMLNNSLNGEVRRRDLEQNMHRIVSRKYHDFFHVYMTSALTQSYHTAQLIYARKQGYKKFLYVGGLVDDSRDFCVERAGHEFFYEQGKEWDEMWWRGKIEGVPFFIQVGGYNCGHHLQWIKEE